MIEGGSTINGRDGDGVEVCKGYLSACCCSICRLKAYLWLEVNRESLEREERRYEYSTRVVNELNRRKSR